MKTIEELTQEMIEAARIQHNAAALELTKDILSAKDCATSKRSMLGLDKTRKAGTTPLFEDKGLF